MLTKLPLLKGSFTFLATYTGSKNVLLKTGTQKPYDPALYSTVFDPSSNVFDYLLEDSEPEPYCQEVELVDINLLKPHEEIVSQERVDNLKHATISWDCYREPLLVDTETYSILDGHHRYAVGKALGLKYLPAVKVDYLGDKSITVDCWPNCGLEMVSKEEVVLMSLSDKLFPPKTSRHSFSNSLPSINVPLSSLRSYN